MKPKPDPKRTSKPSKNRCPECLYHVRGPNHDKGRAPQQPPPRSQSRTREEKVVPTFPKPLTYR